MLYPSELPWHPGHQPGLSGAPAPPQHLSHCAAAQVPSPQADSGSVWVPPSSCWADITEGGQGDVWAGSKDGAGVQTCHLGWVPRHCCLAIFPDTELIHYKPSQSFQISLYHLLQVCKLFVVSKASVASVFILFALAMSQCTKSYV